VAFTIAEASCCVSLALAPSHPTTRVHPRDMNPAGGASFSPLLHASERLVAAHDTSERWHAGCGSALFRGLLSAASRTSRASKDQLPAKSLP
jgi:hypothetical protein